MKSTNLLISATAIAFGILCSISGAQPVDSGLDAKPLAVESLQLGVIRNLKCVDDLYCSGAISQADILLLQKEDVKRIISLRMPSEIDWDEAALVKAAGMEFIHLPVDGPADMTDEVFARVRVELGNDEKKTLVHCAGGGRVATVWLPFRVLDQNVTLETALEEAAALGLYSSQMRKVAVDYIARVQAQEQASQNGSADLQELETAETQSVKPGINDSYLDENLNVDEFVKRFEIESREIFVAREKILAACPLKKGMAVADIGAGTGLFSRMFSVNVGDEGWVYAVDIAPRFLEHINQQSDKYGLNNISPVLCTAKHSSLPPDSIDLVFICDTYHHFEYPRSTLTSIHRALKSDGTLIIVDFERIPGISRDWILDHVRAGKEIVQQEIESAGFELVEEKKIPGLEENYFLQFRKAEK
jgi:uncharacterized protein (TIGR01244 family)